MSIHILPYNLYSVSARTLKNALGVTRINPVEAHSRFRASGTKTIINWGNNDMPGHVAGCGRYINPPALVRRATDKTAFLLQVCGEARVPDFTTRRGLAQSWIEDGKTVVCRTLTRANSGRGIVIAETSEELVDAPLYTQYVPKKSEWRVHCYRNPRTSAVAHFDVQRKARDRSVADEDVNWKVRNNSNGFIFARNEDAGDVPADVITQAVEAFNATGLDFGAVDVIYQERSGEAYVLEVNTAPGLTGTTVDNYVEMFREIL